MGEALLCAQCQKTVPADAPQGLCPACMLQLGLGGDSVELADKQTIAPRQVVTGPESSYPARAEMMEDGETLPPRLPLFSGEETVPPQDGGLASEPASPALSATSVNIPGYEILGELGRGGMGVVYKARQLGLKRLCALKMILAGGHAGDADLARFGTEAESIARLQHPHIVTIYEIGQHEGKPFFSMEFCSGGSLECKLNSTPIDSREAAQLVETLAEAMQTAHTAHVIHRDLKPANVLLTADGMAKITDFGLAKKLDDVGKTQTGAIMGTPSYMAPEQAEGKKVGPLADVYALGAILYDCLTGRPPFRAANSLDTILQVIGQDPVPPMQLNAKVPKDLDTVTLKCLNKDPYKRYATAADLADDLRRFVAGEPILARPVGRAERVVKWVRRRPVVSALLAAVVLVTLVGVGGMTWAYGLALRERDNARERADENRKALAVSQGLLAQAAWDGGHVTLAHEQLGQVPFDLRFWDWHYRKRFFTGGLFTLLHKGHTADVLGVAFSPDGQRLASAGHPTVKVWDARNGQELLTLQGDALTLPPGGRTQTRPAGQAPLSFKGHTSLVHSVAYSPDGLRLASASSDSTVKVWDARTGKGLLTLEGHTSGVESVAFSPDGRRLASASVGIILPAKPGEVKVWDARSGKELLNLNGHTSVAFSPDGQRLASGGRDRTVKVWNVQTGQELVSFKGGTNVAFSPDGLCLASGGGDGTLKVWNVQTGKELLSIKGHARTMNAVAFSPDGQHLVSVGTNLPVKLGDARTGQETVKVWNARTGQELFTLKGHTREVMGVAFSPDGQRLASGSMDGTVKMWDARVGQGELPLSGISGLLSSMAFSADCERLVTAEGLVVKVWDVRSGQVLLTLKGHSNQVISVAFSPDGKRLASGSTGGRPEGKSLPGEVKVWDAQTGQELVTLKERTSPVTCLAFSHDGERLAVASASSPPTGTPHSGEVILLDALSGQELLTLKGHTNVVVSVAFSPDGKRLVAASMDGTVKVWDVRAGQELLSFKGHISQVTSVAFSSDGQRLASAGADRAAKIWDARTGQELLNLKGHTGPVTRVAFSPDGQRLASADQQDQTVKVWDARTGQELLTLKGLSALPFGLSFSPDGHRLASASSLGTVKVWDARPIVDPPDAEELTNRERTTRLNSAWQAGQAARHEQAGQWFAAVFHLKQLLKPEPDNPELQARLKKAEGRLKADKKQ